MSSEHVTFELPDWLKPAKTRTDTDTVLDDLVEQLSNDQISQTEKQLLDKTHWSQGQSVRLRDDNRFKQTPWGNWLLADDNLFLINDWLYEQFIEGVYLQASLTQCLGEASDNFNQVVQFCTADPRFKRSGDDLRLDDKLLSHEPHFSDDPGEGRFVTHLPFYDLKVIAASEPAGEWGESAEARVVIEGKNSLLEDALSAESWVHVDISGTKLNSNMFVSRIHGHSMDNGKKGLVDGALAVFEYWPKGSRQDKIVVVRGAFHDPETGSYALKQYKADSRNEQGEHQEIILHSLNPDKEHYPDIHLKPELDDDLVVVAEHKFVLGENEYVREPKVVVPDDERDIQDGDAQRKRCKKLESIHQRVFSEDMSVPGNDSADEIFGLTWTCLSAEEGGAALEITALTFLPKFLKKLELHYGDQFDILLASNYRHHPRFKVVSPDFKNYKLQAPEVFQDDFDDEFTPWQLTGLSKESIHWFRVDASGVGRQVSGESWSEGNIYRALAVSELLSSVPEEYISTLKNDWSMLEFEFGSECPEWISSLTGAKNETQRRLQLTWVNNSPVAWQTIKNETELAIFNSYSMPILSIKQPDENTEIKSGVFVILNDGKHSETVMLTDGTEWQLRLAELQQGNYVIQTIPVDKQLATEFRPFVIDDSINLDSPLAHYSLQVSTRDGEIFDNMDVFEPVDWSELNKEHFFCNELFALLPPHWPLWLSIHTSVYVIGGSYQADDDGKLDLLDVLTLLLPNLKNTTAAIINLDAGELGTKTLIHNRTLSPDMVQKSVSELWNGFDDRRQQLFSDSELLTQSWLIPLFEEWGGQLQLLSDTSLLDIKEIQRLFLWVSYDLDDSHVVSHQIPVLLVSKDCDDALAKGGHLRLACNTFLKSRNQRRILVTDGLRFAVLNRNSYIKLNWFYIEEMKDDSGITNHWLGQLEGGS